jgi:hypothetical protein
MARSPSRRSLVVWLASGLLVWSCASTPGPGPDDGGAGRTSAGAGGASAGAGGSSGDVGGAAAVGNQAGGGQGGTAGYSGGSGGGTSGAAASEVGGGASEGGIGNEGGAGASGAAGAAGASEGGAAGSDGLEATFDGRCGQGWAAPDSASLPDLEGSVVPDVDSAGNWSFSFGRYRLVVAAQRGARVVEFSIDGTNLIDPTNGSTFWPSPQQAYTWPPPAEIDSAAYVAKLTESTLSLTSKISKTLGLSVQKRFWVNATSGVVSIEYQLVNESKLSASWAPWEVTRVRAGGYTFAPRGPGNRTITQDSFQYPLPLSLLPPAPAANGIEWLNYPSLTLTQANYIGEFDGAEGWLAHANRFGKNLLPALFVKSFVDAEDESLPENQAEIQLWTSGTANPKLIEVEQQGALQELLPGASLSWTVHWSACELPSATVLAAGNATLAELARAHAIKP